MIHSLSEYPADPLSAAAYTGIAFTGSIVRTITRINPQAAHFFFNFAFIASSFYYTPRTSGVRRSGSNIFLSRPLPARFKETDSQYAILILKKRRQSHKLAGFNLADCDIPLSGLNILTY
jgi:hypothetical protein